MSSTRWCVAFTLPIMLGLAILGDSVIVLWMGPHYVHPWLTATLALGMFLPVAQGPAVQILIGLDAHGRVMERSIHQSSGNELLDAAALDAAQRWQFREGRDPYLVVPVWFKVTD